MNEIEQYFIKKCQQYDLPAPQHGEKYEVALGKIRTLIEYLEVKNEQRPD